MTAGRERGFALLVVLWAMVLLALMVTQLTASSRQETEIAFNLRSNAMLQAAASGAVQEAAFHLLDPGAAHWVANDQVHILRSPGIAVSVVVSPEDGKVNPNIAEPQLMQALLLRLGVAQDRAAALAAAIAAWRLPAIGTGTAATAAAYRSAGLGYIPPGKPFQSLDELGLVLGMTPAILQRLLPHLTLFTTGDPNAADADPIVALALRDTEGDVPHAPGAGGEPVVSVIASAVGEGAASGRFVRRATLAIGEDVDGNPFRVLAWDGGPQAAP